jgi:hypothetical protein
MSENRSISPALIPALGVTLVVALVVALTVTLAGPAPKSNAARAKMTNGCTVSTRGIPSCGAYVGAAYGANANPLAWERRMHKKLGVHRTFWGGRDVGKAIRQARVDAAHNRLPWISFKAPYSWSAMASGRGDAWARGVARMIKKVRGPVWVAIHHEPEGDGNIRVWRAMQQRLAPIMRRTAPNLGYTIILMGYHEFYGAKQYRMSNLWPNTKIDVAGFDIYESYGVPGKSKWKNFYRSYFIPIQRWARAKHVAWGLAETGYSDPAAKRQPRWMRKVYTQMVNHGGKAFTYFNTNLNSKANWKLSLATKQNAFARLNKTAPRMR